MGMINKKGQGLSVETVILIVIGVLVLVFLILGFTMGWNKIFPFINPPNNVKDITDKCGYACQTDDKYGYCSSNRDVTVESDIVINDITGAKVMVSKGKKISASCYELSAIAALGMPACLNVVCGDDFAYRSEDFAKVACVNNRQARALNFTDATGNIKQYQCTVG